MRKIKMLLHEPSKDPQKKKPRESRFDHDRDRHAQTGYDRITAQKVLEETLLPTARGMRWVVEQLARLADYDMELVLSEVVRRDRRRAGSDVWRTAMEVLDAE